MLLVDDILLAPFSSLLWIFREIRNAAQKEIDGESESITEQLRSLYMQLETGKISEQQFDAEEKLLLDRLDALDDIAPPEESAEEPESEAADQSHLVTRRTK